MNLQKILGFVAVGGLLVVAAPSGQAQAASLINPGIAASIQGDQAKMVTEVRWHRGWRHRHWRHRRW